MAGTSDLASRLRPWHAALRQLGEPVGYSTFDPRQEADAPRTLWLATEPTDQKSPEPRARAVEAVALLNALARVDLAAWQRALLQIWPTVSMQEWIDEYVAFETKERKFKVGIEIKLNRARDVKQLDAFNNGGASIEFHELYGELLATAKVRRVDAPSVRVPIQIQLGVFDVEPLVVQELLEELQESLQELALFEKPKEVQETNPCCWVEQVRLVDTCGCVWDISSTL